MIKVLALNDNINIKYFNTNNFWVNLDGTTLKTLKDADFEKYGVLLDTVETKHNTVLYDFAKIKSYDTGESMYMSQEVDNNLGVKGLSTTVDSNGTNKLVVQIPDYIPSDNLTSKDKLLYLFSGEDNKPVFGKIGNDTIKFSASQTHDDMISFNFKIIYTYNKKVKFRYRVNEDGFTGWTTPEYPYQTNFFSGSVATYSMKVGKNSFEVQVMDADADENKAENITSLKIDNAFELLNNLPNILLVKSDCDNFKLHFIVSDKDIKDKLQYKLSLVNSKYPEGVLLKDWTEVKAKENDITHYIDTSKVVLDEINSITIYCKDNYNGESNVVYTFTGQYKNIVFLDGNNEYYTSDRGVILKILNLDTVIAGQTTEPVEVKIKNSNPDSITGLKLSTIMHTKDVNGIKIEYSKSNNPFSSLDEINYGNEVIKSNDVKSFYIRLNTELNATLGDLEFDINATAN